MKSALSLTTIFLAVSAIPVAAQPHEAEAAWSLVRQLPPGVEIIVSVKGEAPIRGYLVSGDTSRLTMLDRAQAHVEFARSDIKEIKTPLPYSPRRDALKGFIFGTATSSLIGVFWCRAEGGTGSCTGDIVKLAALGGGFTAGIGLGAGAIKHLVKSAQVIYRAP